MKQRIEIQRESVTPKVCLFFFKYRQNWQTFSQIKGKKEKRETTKIRNGNWGNTTDLIQLKRSINKYYK